MAGLTTTGFITKRQIEILADLQADLRDKFGEVGTGPDQVFGVLAAILSSPLADLWEQLGAVYSSQYRTADGMSLDQVAQFTGLTRIVASPSRVRVAFGGSAAAVVPIGTQTQAGETGPIVTTIEQATISPSAAVKADITVAAAEDDTNYTVTIDGHAFTINSGSGATEESIATALAAAIDADDDLEAAADGASLSVRIVDLENTFSVSVGSLLTLERTYAQAISVATVDGPTAIPSGSIDTIVTPVSGVTAATNLEQETPGRYQESDADLRTRIVTTPNGAGSSTEPAIKAALQNTIEGVSSVSVISNRTDEDDEEGRPPHSFEVIILSPGGDDDAIAQAIYNNAPAGIRIVSTSNDPAEGTARDVNGNNVIIPFSRPTEKKVWLWIDLELFDEETFPSDGLARVRDAVLAVGRTAQPGIDIIVQKFYGGIYTVPGIATATIYMAVSETEPPKPTEPAENYTIAASEIATYAADRIVVAEA